MNGNLFAITLRAAIGVATAKDPGK